MRRNFSLVFSAINVIDFSNIRFILWFFLGPNWWVLEELFGARGKAVRGSLVTSCLLSIHHSSSAVTSVLNHESMSYDFRNLMARTTKCVHLWLLVAAIRHKLSPRLARRSALAVCVPLTAHPGWRRSCSRALWICSQCILSSCKWTFNLPPVSANSHLHLLKRRSNSLFLHFYPFHCSQKMIFSAEKMETVI